MRRLLTSFLVLLGVGAWWSAASLPSTADAGTPPPVAAALSQLRFVPNHGQWHPEVRFAALGDTAGWLHDDGFSLRFERWCEPAGAGHRAHAGNVVRTRFLGAAVPTFVPGRDLAVRNHFCLGRDAAQWRTDVPSHANVRMVGVLPGIDVEFRPLPEGQRGAFEYDLVLAPGADLDRFVAECEGVEALSIDADGRLCAQIETPSGPAELVQQAPIAWQVTEHGRVPRTVGFRLLGTRRYGFVGTDLDPALPTVVDPGIVWGTWLGGGASDSISDLEWRPGVGVWVAGWAGSTDFPVTTGAYDTVGGVDAFVAQLAPNGQSLVYATYVGGSGGEEARALALGPGNTPTITGFTASTDFPVTAGAVRPTFSGGSPFLQVGDAFVVRLAANGSALLASTYLGASTDDIGEDVAIAANGDAIVVGWTLSADFPTTPGSFRPTFASIPGIDTDGFVTRVAANAQSLVFSTFLGGIWSDQLQSVDLDAATGDVVVAGTSGSPNYPTTLNAYRTTSGGDADAVLTRLNASGSAAVYSTYFGGVSADAGHDARLAADGSVWLVGRSASSNFPVTLNAIQSTNAGEYDAFVSHLSANGQSLLFSTLLGGPGADAARSVDVDAVGIAIVGETAGGFPVTNDAIQGTFATGSLDGWFTLLTNGGATLGFSTYLGGVAQDFLAAVQLDATGLAVVAGWSFSADFPIAPAGYQAVRRGVQDGVVVAIDLVNQLLLGVSVAAPPPGAPTTVPPGRHELLQAALTNQTDRTVTVEAVELLVAGAGDAAAHVRQLRVTAAVAGGAEVPVAGPFDVAADDTTVLVPLTSVVLPPAAVAVLRVDGDVVADAAGATVEAASAIVDGAAWHLRADGAAGGPTVRVLGTGRAEGPVLVAGAMPGDVDGDGAPTIHDLRALLQRLGTGAPAYDCDADGLVTVADVALVRTAVLGRPALAAVPAVLHPGEWFTLRGVFAGTLLEATLGGRALTPGRVTARELTLRVEPDQATGTKDLSVLLDGRRVVLATVLVQ
ncbi:MAG: hypothetical protein JNL08_11560 [Planctomycetes bacterium]|nr:hypothetical protein [Planctomycetota bacterium]